MMNEARIGVGLGATALGYTGYLHALDYARTRTQGRPPAAQGPAGAAGADHRARRRAADAAGRQELRRGRAGARAVLRAAGRRGADRGDRRRTRARAHLLLEVLTPIAKSWPSQWGLAANDLAIQVHGGYGYTRDFPVEQFYRDNRLNPIHEGTVGHPGRWTCWAARSCAGGGEGLRAAGRDRSPRPRPARRAPSGPTSPPTWTPRWPGSAR